MKNTSDRKLKKFVNRIIFFVSLAVFLVAAVSLIRIAWDYHSSNKEYDKMQQYIQIQDTGTGSEEEAAGAGPVYSVNFEHLQSENPDCVGWIRFPNMDISYPIMQGVDNDQYLRHTFSGEYATAGSIFIDAANAPDFSDENTFVYGHDMKNESMFGQLKQYEEEAFYRESPGFYIYTPKGSSYYLIYSCYLAPVVGQEESFAISFESEEGYLEFLEYTKGKSLYDTGVTPDGTQNAVTLMTCNRAGQNYRLLVHAVQTDFVPNE